MEIVWNLLYVDDDTQSINTFVNLFKEYYTLFSAATVNECMEILKKNDIHLIMIDQKIPENSGIEFIETISTEYPGTIILLTGLSDNVDVLIGAINSGDITRFITKPWDKNALKKTIEDSLIMYVKRQADELLVKDLQNIIEEMKFLYKITQKLSEKKSLPRLLHEIMESSKLLMNAEASSLLLYDPDDKKLYFQVATGEKGKLVKKFSMDLGVGIAGWVAKNKKPLLIEDCYKDSRFNPEYDKKSRFRTKSMICVPLIRKNKLLGVIEVINKRKGGKFDERDLTIFETLASQCAIAIENNRLIERQIEAEALERELETAREIQQKLLPSSLPEYEDIQIAAQLIPAKQVGGDYYNILKIDENQSLFFIADVTGKGIPAALIVSTIYSCLTSYLKLNRDQFDLMTLVIGMNKVLLESTTSTKFATSWFGLYSHDTKKLISVNAGHNPPYIFRHGNKDPLSLCTGGLFLGGLDGPYQSEEIQLKREDVLVFFTDGVTEAWNTKEVDYGEDRLIHVIFEQVKQSAENILSEIENDVKKHVGKAQQSDDFTCAIVKIL